MVNEPVCPVKIGIVEQDHKQNTYDKIRNTILRYIFIMQCITGI